MASKAITLTVCSPLDGLLDLAAKHDLNRDLLFFHPENGNLKIISQTKRTYYL